MADWLQQTLGNTKQASPQQNATSSGDWLSSVASRKGQPAQQTPYDQPQVQPTIEPQPTQQAPQNLFQKATSLLSLVSQTVEKKLTSANIQPVTPKDIAKVLIPEPVRNTANQLADKYVAGGAQGMKDRIKNLPNYPARELFQITSADKYGQAERQYVKDTLVSAVRAIDGAGKLTAPYLIYRASIGDPVKPQEYVDNIKSYGMEMLGLAWRAEPLSPLVNVGMGALQGIRHYLEGKIDNKQLMETPLAGLNNSPGFGEVLTDNVETAKAINIVFLATMIATPFARKGLRNVAMTSEELNMASRDLGVKPGASLQEVSKVWKEKLKQLPDTFTGNPNPENMAMRVKLNDAYTVLKKAGVIDSKFAQAYEFLQRKMGNKPLEAVGFKPVPEKPLQLTSGEKPKTEVKPIDTQLTAKSDTLISHEGAPDLKTVEQYKADIQAGKTIEPVKVIREGDKYGIEDGKHRFQAFQELGIKDIPITIVDTPKVDTKTTANIANTNNSSISKDSKELQQAVPDMSKETANILRGTKGLTADDIMKTHPDIKLSREVPVTDVHGNKTKIPDGEVLTPYEMKGNKVLLQDGQTYLISKSQFQNIKGQSVSKEASDFAPELKQTEDTVLSDSKSKTSNDIKWTKNGDNLVGTLDGRTFLINKEPNGYYVAEKNGRLGRLERNYTQAIEALDSYLKDKVNTKASTAKTNFSSKIQELKRKGLQEYEANKARAERTALNLEKQAEANPAPKEVVPAPTVSEVKPKVVSVPREQLPIKSQGDVKTSKLEARMKGVLDKATQEQIDALGLSTFNQMNKAEQKTIAIEYVKNNPEDAMKVLKGDIEPPKGILKNSIYIAMDALASDNVELARKLASLESTRFGQELSILTELNPNSPVTVIKEIIKVKEDAFKKKYGKPVKEVVKKERAKIDKSIKTPDKWDWSAFVDSIKC